MVGIYAAVVKLIEKDVSLTEKMPSSLSKKLLP